MKCCKRHFIACKQCYVFIPDCKEETHLVEHDLNYPPSPDKSFETKLNDDLVDPSESISSPPLGQHLKIVSREKEVTVNPTEQDNHITFRNDAHETIDDLEKPPMSSSAPSLGHNLENVHKEKENK